MTKKEDIKDDYNERFHARMEQYQKDVTTWTEDEINEHLNKIKQYYGVGSRTANLLGDFSWDTENDYLVHTYDSNPTKLEKRLQTGYSFATREECRRAGLEERRMQDSLLAGATCVELNCGDMTGVILKIPKKLAELNRIAKEAQNKKEQMLDANGIMARVRERIKGNSIERQRDEVDIEFKGL